MFAHFTPFECLRRAHKAMFVPMLLAAVMVSTVIAHSVRGADFHWSPQCGDNNWLTQCYGDICVPGWGVRYCMTNWGQGACGVCPLGPNGNDDVYIGGGEVVIVDGSAPAHSLSLGDGAHLTLGVEGQPYACLSVNGGSIKNAGHLTVRQYAGTICGVSMLPPGVLTGGGTVTLAGGYISGTPLVNENNTIQGWGDLGLINTGATLENHCLVDANSPSTPQPGGSRRLFCRVAGVNTGTMQASNGGTLEIGTSIVNTGGIVQAISGGTVIFGGPGFGWASITGGTVRADGGTIVGSGLVDVPIQIVNNGALQADYLGITTPAISLDITSNLHVASELRISRELTFAMTDESKWSWVPNDLHYFRLTMDGSSPLGGWATLEIGGEDNGPETGYAINFNLPALYVATGAAAALVDLKDNGNRLGGKAEALYVDTSLAVDGLLNLNGLKLYVGGVEVHAGDSYGSGRIIDVPADDPFAVFEACATGPAVSYDRYNLSVNCGFVPDAEGHITPDFDRDGDVDQNDFGTWQRCYSGQGQTPDPNCSK